MAEPGGVGNWRHVPPQSSMWGISTPTKFYSGTCMIQAFMYAHVCVSVGVKSARLCPWFELCRLCASGLD